MGLGSIECCWWLPPIPPSSFPAIPRKNLGEMSVAEEVRGKMENGLRRFKVRNRTYGNTAFYVSMQPKDTCSISCLCLCRRSSRLFLVESWPKIFWIAVAYHAHSQQIMTQQHRDSLLGYIHGSWSLLANQDSLLVKNIMVNCLKKRIC
jgi:hypothetical protein